MALNFGNIIDGIFRHLQASVANADVDGRIYFVEHPKEDESPPKYIIFDVKLLKPGFAQYVMGTGGPTGRREDVQVTITAWVDEANCEEATRLFDKVAAAMDLAQPAITGYSTSGDMALRKLVEVRREERRWWGVQGTWEFLAQES